MKEYNIGQNTILVVEVPEDTVHAEMFDKESSPLAVLIYRKDPQGLFNPGIPQPIWPIPEGKWEVLGKASSITEQQAKGLVEGYGNGMYYDYRLPFMFGRKDTPIESFSSWLTANGIDKDSVILKKE